MALYGRHGESPMPVVAAYGPAQCFDAAIEASRIALKYRTPVLLLTDGYLANGAEPWLLPDVESLPDISVDFATGPNDVDADGNDVFHPYKRDPETLARPWALPGTPGLEHRVGGLEKADVTGNVNYDPSNHSRMTDLRQAKVDGIAKDIPLAEVQGDGTANILLVGWGSPTARSPRPGKSSPTKASLPTTCTSRTCTPSRRTSATSFAATTTCSCPNSTRGSS
ncbi:MAG: hypothetical protein R2710_09200 [Acidimicrobiales bacterium]